MLGNDNLDPRERMRKSADLPTNTSELMQYAIRSYLQNFNFPADKDSLLRQARHWGAPQEVMGLLTQIQSREYQNAAEVTGKLGLMQQ